MVQLFLDGGGFMWPILAVLIVGCALVIERLYHLIKGLSSNEDTANKISDCIKSNNLQEAQNQCDSTVGPVANLCHVAIDSATEGPEETEKSLDQAGTIEMASLEKNMSWISLCIAIAPMIGFLGTVWGMIEAFNDIKAANDISPKIVAGGISVALLTTAFGLIAAVILQILQNAVLYIIDNQIVTMQKSSSSLIQAVKKSFTK